MRAFPALRYDVSVAGPLADLICPPYDVISPDERAKLAARSERNLVHVELPEPTRAGYERAGALLRRWREDGSLTLDPPSVYVHDHEFRLGTARLVRRGVFVALRLYASSEGVVLPHERTFPKAKADRLAVLRATRANTSPVFGMVDGSAMSTLDGAVRTGAGEARLGDDAHRLGRISEPTVLASFVEALREARVYIADGHHRYETAFAYATEREAALATMKRGLGPDAPERYVLMYLCAFDDPGLRILATHRVVTGGGAALDTAIARSFEASPIDRGALGDVQPGIVLVRDGTFTRLEPRPDADRSALPAAWRDLPVAIAEALLLEAARAAGAEIAYEHDTERAVDAASGGRSAVLLRAVDPDTLRRVADAGERLPQKTTYFYPKVPAGLVIRSLDIG